MQFKLSIFLSQCPFLKGCRTFLGNSSGSLQCKFTTTQFYSTTRHSLQGNTKNQRLYNSLWLQSWHRPSSGFKHALTSCHCELAAVHSCSCFADCPWPHQPIKFAIAMEWWLWILRSSYNIFACITCTPYNEKKKSKYPIYSIVTLVSFNSFLCLISTPALHWNNG